MHFVSGAADEKLAYSSLAVVYCSFVKALTPYLIMMRHGHKAGTDERLTSGPFHNVVALYQTWSSRLEMERVDEQVAKLEIKREGIHITNIPVLGRK